MIEDAHRLLAFLNRLTDIHEAASPIPWKVSDAPADFIEAMMHAIVGLEVPIQRLEGKWKVSQNRTESERQGVMEGLGKLDTSASRAMKSLVEDATPENEGQRTPGNLRCVANQVQQCRGGGGEDFGAESPAGQSADRDHQERRRTEIVVGHGGKEDSREAQGWAGDCVVYH